MGTHEGLPFYTMGQRKGMGVGGQAEPIYVKRVDSIKNALIVGHESELWSHEINVRDMNFLSGKAPTDDNEEFLIKIRSHGKMGRAKLHMTGTNTARVECIDPQWSVMPGQSLVIYKNDELVGGGIMETAL